MALESLSSSLEALSSTELLNFIIYDTISGIPYTNSSSHDSSPTDTKLFLFDDTTNITINNANNNSNGVTAPEFDDAAAAASGGLKFSCMKQRCGSPTAVVEGRRRQRQQNLAVQGEKKKRRRRPKVCKNKEEAEAQRMTHIAVERNRRKQMNEHLAVLRSLMPESFVQRGDQASIVGGAIEFVKELEHLLQSLEAQKLLMLQEFGIRSIGADASSAASAAARFLQQPPPFSQFFAYPQYTCSQMSNKYTSSKTKAAVADIEVTLIETHANIRILSQRRTRQLSKIVAGLQTLSLSILHLNLTSLDPLVLYSISAKVEEGCQLSSADDIAGAVHHMLRIIEEEAQEATFC